MAGAKELASHHPEISEIPLFVVCEPTDLCPIVDEKGIVQFKITTMGKSAHASMPELGKNAIVELMDRLRNLTTSELFGTHRDDPVTISINLISGGTGMNIVPEEASATIDVRFVAKYTNAEMLNIMKKIVRADDGLVEVELLHELIPVKSAIPDELLTRIENLVGGKSFKVPFGTEMAVFSKLNKNIIILGPGGLTMAHQTDEWIDINDVVKAVAVYVELATWF